MPARLSLIDTARKFRDWVTLPNDAKRVTLQDRRNAMTEDPGIEAAVAATVSWLCLAQDSSSTEDGGIARHFSLLDGWGPSYPETTGYIIPTLLTYGQRTQDDALRERCRRMLDWFVTIQLRCGGFQGGTVNDSPVVPVVFNTGQILMGLAAGSSTFGEPYTTAMHRAATWLAEIQDTDGNWRKHNSPFARSGDKTYDTHTAWGLLEAARASDNTLYGDIALRNIHWAIARQQGNGWLADCCLTDPSQPLTHTLGYALKGIIEGYRYSGDEALLTAALHTASGLLHCVGNNGHLPGRLDERWSGTVPWACLTGSVQIAQCFLDLFQLCGDRKFLSGALRLTRYVRCTVQIDGPPATRGAIRGSFPVDGAYGQFQYLNWAAKFFIDANLLEADVVASEA